MMETKATAAPKKSRTEDALLGFYAGTDYLSIIIASFRILNVLRNIGI